MKADWEILEKIDKYHQKMLSEAEYEDFSQELETNPELKELMSLSKLVDDSVMAMEHIKLKEQMQKDLNSSHKKWVKVYFISAALLTTGGLLYYFYHNSNVTPHTEPPKKDSVTIKSITSPSSTTPLELAKTKVGAKTETRVLNYNSSFKVTENKTISITPQNKTHVLITKEDYNSSPHNSIDSVKISGNKNHNFHTPNPCKNLSYSVDFETAASCANKATGKIIFTSSIQNCNHKPCQIYVEKSPISTDLQENLHSGIYTIYIKDVNECVVSLPEKAIVEEIICEKTTNFVFNPEFDKTWIYPKTDHTKILTFSIKDKSGKEIYTLSQSDEISWNGTSKNGQLVEIGIYFYEINYSNQTIEVGTITVTQ